MKIASITLVVLSTLLVSCSTGKKSAKTSISSSSATIADVPENERDGSSFEKAIIIHENTSRAGISAEYAWVRYNYPDSKVVRQSLHHAGKRSYDILTVQKADGTEVEVYFDITKFFGKF